MRAARVLLWPMRSNSSRGLAPAAPARVLPVMAQIMEIESR